MAHLFITESIIARAHSLPSILRQFIIIAFALYKFVFGIYKHLPESVQRRSIFINLRSVQRRSIFINLRSVFINISLNPYKGVRFL